MEDIIIGRFGEDLLFTKTNKGMYLFSSYVLDLYDLEITEPSKDIIINKYCVKGNYDFDRKGVMMLNRCKNLGRDLYKYYCLYQQTKSEEILDKIKLILDDSKQFKLNRTKYVDLFLSFGSKLSLDYIKQLKRLNS